MKAIDMVDEITKELVKTSGRTILNELEDVYAKDCLDDIVVFRIAHHEVLMELNVEPLPDLMTSMSILCPKCEFVAHWNDSECKYQCDNCNWGYDELLDEMAIWITTVNSTEVFPRSEIDGLGIAINYNSSSILAKYDKHKADVTKMETTDEESTNGNG